MKVTILGCGASGGSPAIGGADGRGEWGRCDPEESRNRRLRASVLVESRGSRLLVDCTPDLRAQCLANDIGHIDAVLFTHDHADHTHGIDDLRRLFYARNTPIPAYGSSQTLDSAVQRFNYAFQQQHDGYRPFLSAKKFSGPFKIGVIEVVPYSQQHGALTSTGYRFGPIAYSTDLTSLPEESYAALKGVEIFIVDALKRTPHPTHANVEAALAMIKRVGARLGVLTHMSTELDYATLAAELPPGVEPGYDGLVLEA